MRAVELKLRSEVGRVKAADDLKFVLGEPREKLLQKALGLNEVDDDICWEII